MMRVLVTGGAGFIGSAIAGRLLAGGHDVVILDNLSTGKRSNLPPGAVFVEADVADPAVLALIPENDYAAVIHLAAQTSGMLSQKNPYADLQANVGSTVLLSRWCLERGVPRFLYASSMTVYGSNNREPVDEGTRCRPISYYGASKLSSEAYLELASDEGLSVTCFRLYNVYGRGQNLGNRYQGMASIYLAYLLEGAAVPVTGSLDRYRDFVHVDDAVDAMTRTLERPHTPSRIYNIGTGRKTTVRELLRLLISAMNMPPGHQIDELEGSPSDIFGSVADCRRARDELGWEARVSLADGLRDMVAWAKDEALPSLAQV
jgi:UDP-glucose 4-epimerase